MRPILSILLFAAGAAVLCPGQVSLTPWTNIQYTDQSGRALSAGKVYTCVAGASCPGNPQATYTTSSGGTAHQNPITLDSSGRPPGGQIWLTSSAAYKIVVTNAAGAVMTGAGGDNISGATGGGGGGGGNNWTLTGANIFNANSGNVGVGTSSPEDKLHVSGNLLVGTGGVLKLRNADLTPHFVGQVAPPGMASDITLTWPGALPGAIGCLKLSPAGAISVDAACSAAPTDTIWSIDMDNNVTLADSMTAVSRVKIQNQTAGTGAAELLIVNGPGNMTGPFRIRNDDANPDWIYVNTGGEFVSREGISIIRNDAISAVVALGATGVPNFSMYALGDGSTFGLARYDNAGAYVADAISIDRASGNTSISDLFVTNATCLGTCTGFGGGGSSQPFTDNSPLVKNQIDNTKTLTFDLGGFTTATNHVLVPQNFNYIIAGTNIANTFSSANIFTGNITMSGANILANGAVAIGTTVSAFNEGYFATLEATANFIIGPPSFTNYRFSISSGDLVMADTLSAPMMRAKTTPKNFTWYGDLLPAAAQTIGYSAQRWSKIWVQDIDIAGTCTGCAGAGGANTALSNLSVTAVNADINPGTSLSRSMGSPTFQWSHVYSNILHSCDTFATNCWGIQSIPGLGGLVFAGPSGNRVIIAPNGTSTIQGASSGALFPLLIADSGGTPGINFYRSTGTKSGSILAGANSPFTVLNQSDTGVFSVFQSGDTQVNSSVDQGYKFYVSGTAFFTSTVYIPTQLDLRSSASIIAPSGAFGASATFNCSTPGQAIKTITVSAGIVTGATCAAP